MCFFYGVNKSMKEIEIAFNAKFDNQEFEPIHEVNGFSHPFMPIIVDKRPDIITAANWGLLPICEKDASFQKNALNTRIETLDEKARSEEHTSELQSREKLVCRLLLEKKKR